MTFGDWAVIPRNYTDIVENGDVMRPIGILALSLSMACGLEPTGLPDLRDIPAPDASMAALEIHLRIEGDTTLNNVIPSLYFARVDTEPSVSVHPSETRTLSVQAGNHDVTLTRIVGFLLMGIPIPLPDEPWCDPVPPLSRQKSFAAGSTTALEFVINCPARIGDGIVSITSFASGENVPDSAQVDFRSRVPPFDLTSVVIPSNGHTDISLNADIYHVGVSLPRCQLSNNQYGLSTGLIVRQDAKADFPIVLACE